MQTTLIAAELLTVAQLAVIAKMEYLREFLITLVARNQGFTRVNFLMVNQFNVIF